MDRKLKILLIDDDLDFAQLISLRLEQAGCLVVHYPNAIDVIDNIKKDPPDFLILDMLMPGVLGSTLCQSIKNDLTLCDVKIAVISGLPIETDDSFKEIKADFYIEKDENIFEKLIEAIQTKNV